MEEFRRTHYPESVLLPFPEDVLESEEPNVILHKEDKDIIIRGDASHKPEVFWVRPDILCLKFPKGSSCRTEYTVEIPQHRAHYRSGKPMEKTTFSVRCPDSPLGITELTGMGRPAFLVMTLGQNTVESQRFSPTSPVKYVFRNTYGEEVGTEVIPAELRHLPSNWKRGFSEEAPSVAPAGIAPLALQRVLRLHRNAPKKIQADTPLPQAVVVFAKHPLTANRKWTLEVLAEPHSGIESGTLVSNYSPELQSEQTLVYTHYRLPQHQGEELMPEIRLAFNTPMSMETFQRLFQDMRFRINGTEATGEREKRLRADNRNISIYPVSAPPAQIHQYDFYQLYSDIPEWDEEKESTDIETFSFLPDTSPFFNIALKGVQPGDEVELILPSNPGYISGLPRLREERHCFRIHEPEPKLYLRKSENGDWELLSMGVHSLRISAGRMPPDAVIALRETISDTCGDFDEENVKPLLAAVEHSGSQQIQIKDSNTYPHRTVLDKKQLCGGQERSGYYLLEMDMDEHGKQWFLMLDSPIQVVQTPFPGQLLVYRADNGEFISSGNLQYREDAESIPISDGMVTLPQEARPDFLFVRSGDDYFLSTAASFCRSETEREDKHPQVQFLTDRFHYYPGETAHVWGVSKSGTGCGILTLQNEAEETVAELKDIPITSTGTFSASLHLPQQAGSYTLSFSTSDGAESHSDSIEIVPAQNTDIRTEYELNFNRDVAPDSWTLNLRAHAAPASSRVKVSIHHSFEQSEDYSCETAADGTATLSGQLGAAKGQPQRIWFCIQLLDKEGRILREHHVRKAIHALDFVVRRQDERIVLHDLQGNILNREQQLQVKVEAEHNAPVRLPNGIVLKRKVREPLFCGDITVPAQCQEGIHIPFAEALKDLRSSEFAPYSSSCLFTFTVPRASGAPVQWTQRIDYSPESSRTMQASAEKGMLRLQFSRECTEDEHALLILNGKRRIPVCLKAGQKELQIPLQPEENGVFHCHLISTNQAYDEAGFLHFSECSCLVKDSPLKLDICHTLIPEGETYRLSGRVTAASGKASKASLCVFAAGSEQQQNFPYLQQHWHRFFFPEPQYGYNSSAYSIVPSPEGIWKRRQPEWSDMKDAYQTGFILGGWPKRHEPSSVWMWRYISPYAPSFYHVTGILVSWDDEWEDNIFPHPSDCIFTRPLLLWEPDIRTDDKGEFSVNLPSVPGTYRLYILAVGENGQTFGQQETDITLPQIP